MSRVIEVYGPLRMYSDIGRWNGDLEGVPVYPRTRIEQPMVVSWQCDGFMCSALSKEFSPAFPDPPEFIEVLW